MSDARSFFATCPKTLEGLLAQELMDLGAQKVRQTRAGVHFKGDLKTAYRVCLWSRLANRVLLPLCTVTAETPDQLYAQVYHQIDWRRHLNVEGSLAVDFTSTGSNRFHSHYAALRVKDAVVDQFNHRLGRRPDVDTQRPHIRINVFMKHNQATLSLDLAGESLHRRGYRTQGGEAPLKENLAAAVLLRAGWPQMAQENRPIVDPMCGSGTLLLEAAMMALDKAPALDRTWFGFSGWNQHDPVAFKDLHSEAKARAEQSAEKNTSLFLGFDKDQTALVRARSNTARAGLSDRVRFHHRDIRQLKAPEVPAPGLVVTNPPYGERMGEKKSLEALYPDLARSLKAHFKGWNAGILTANPELTKQMGIRAKKIYRFYNGALPCQLLNFEIHASWYMAGKDQAPAERHFRPVSDAGSDMFYNRLKKNLKRIGKWAKKQGISCYRLYDSDMPEYAVAIDVYDHWVHVQEYQAPAGVQPENARKRLNQVMAVLPAALNTSPDHMVLKKRRKTRGNTQYAKLAATGRFFEVREGGLRFLVNLTDYLDTGLFLDQRLTRERIRDYAAGKRVLNLFCYTGAATVYAAAGGALKTTSVDMSGSYLSWARKNLALNGLDEKQNELIQADCLQWIRDCRKRYDFIFLDPPTFSNSKRMTGSLDIQRDHVPLLKQVIHLLTENGLLIFSANKRNFRLDKAALSSCRVRDISLATTPMDFERRKHSHHCFEIRPCPHFDAIQDTGVYRRNDEG